MRRCVVDIYNGEGGADDDLFPTIFKPLPDTDVSDPEQFADALWRSNPSMNTTVTESWRRQQYEIAAASPDPTDLDIFKSQHLNMLVDTSNAGIDGWSVARRWSEYVDPGVTVEAIIRECAEVYVGVEAGGADDLSSVALLGRRPDGTWMLAARRWLTQESFEAWPKKRELYNEAIAAGELDIVDVPGEDLEEMAALLLGIRNLRAIGVDPVGVEMLITRVQEDGHDPVGVPQGYRLSPYLEGLEREYGAGRVRHGTGPLLRWCAQNVRLKDRGGAKAIVKPSGEAAGPEKIDAIVSAIMAYAVISAGPPPSVFEEVERPLHLVM